MKKRWIKCNLILSFNKTCESYGLFERCAVHVQFYSQQHVMTFEYLTIKINFIFARLTCCRYTDCIWWTMSWASIRLLQIPEQLWSSNCIYTENMWFCSNRNVRVAHFDCMGARHLIYYACSVRFMHIRLWYLVYFTMIFDASIQPNRISKSVPFTHLFIYFYCVRTLELDGMLKVRGSCYCWLVHFVVFPPLSDIQLQISCLI